MPDAFASTGCSHDGPVEAYKNNGKNSMEAALWGGVVRFVQAVAEGTPTFLVGLIVAGVFRRLIGPEGTRKLFGGGTVRSLLQSWAIGMLLPVCSLGVIPVAYEMRRAGVSGGAILAFALTAPLFNPLSLLYGLTLSASHRHRGLRPMFPATGDGHRIRMESNLRRTGRTRARRYASSTRHQNACSPWWLKPPDMPRDQRSCTA